jgi:cell division protein FtsB
MKLPKLNKKRIALIGAVVVLVLLMMDFNNRMGNYLRLREQEQTVGTQIGELMATEQALKTQIAYATSDVAVEQWAREQGRLIQPGDVPIVPLSPPGSTSPTPAVLAPTPQPVSNWQVWQALFFGQ